MDRYEGFREFAAVRDRALSRTAYLLTGSREAAEDLVQETYVEALRRWRTIDHARPEAYVRRILYSRFVDGVRRRRVREWFGSDVDVADVRDHASDAAVRLTLAQALDRLTPHQRAVLVLRFYEDLSEVQTAQVLGVSQSTVKSQTRLALRRLRELAPDLVDDLAPATEVTE